MYKYFLVSYDLHKMRNYAKAETGIEISCKDYIKPLESVYIVKTDYNKKASELRDSIARYMDNDDSLMVIECNINSWAARKIDSSITNTMKEWK